MSPGMRPSWPLTTARILFVGYKGGGTELRTTLNLNWLLLVATRAKLFGRV